MKNTLLRLLLFLTACMSFSACKKSMDDCGCTPVASNCRIETYKFIIFDIPLTANFSYNVNNDPLSIVVENGDKFAISNMFFKYDSQNRLLGYHKTFDTTYTGDIDTMYRYVNDSLIVTTNNIDTFNLDNKGRVIRHSYIEYEYHYVKTFFYNADGNLRRSDRETYDLTTKNIRATNKVWQFLDLDYSVNMSQHEGYDYIPSGYPGTVEYNISPFLGWDLEDSATVTYSCK
ncbi:hypothetical protein QTN47_15025 [Danxiaibacter flavus]|uniref:DUF4595 domain-containing protein n=1 Tax=Danxiaibacter flavus TaxID=3049108 RepID=A0ABV3ZJX8_9BACT|nr:hypothetical protein QNM32_15035 [Chitinophagaceae bacterium DXS]